MGSLILAAALLAAPAFVQSTDTSATTSNAPSANAAVPAPNTAATKYSTSTTDIGTLLDNPATKAILTKYLPEVVNSDQIDMARAMTLKQIQSYSPDAITDAKLAQVDADLGKLKN